MVDSLVSVDALLATIAFGNDITWSFREHRNNPGFSMAAVYTIATGGEFRTQITPAGQIGLSWFFKVFRKSDITGRDIKVEWNNPQAGSNNFRINDGAYDPSSNTDFPDGANIPLKGIGGLVAGGVYGGTPFVTTTLLASNINYAGSTEEFITVFVMLADTQNSSTAEYNVRSIEVVGLGKWLFDNSPTPTLTQVVSGTIGFDYGYVNASSVVPPPNTETFFVDALIQRVNGQCGVDLTGLVAYWNLDQSSGAGVNDAATIGSPDSGGSDWNLISLGGHTFLQAGIVGTSVDSNGISSGQWRTSSTITSLASFITNKATTAGWTINYWLKYDAVASAFVYILNSAGSGGSNIGNEHFMIQGGVLRARVRQFNSGNGEVYSPQSTLTLPNDTKFHMYTIGYDKTTNEIIYGIDGKTERIVNTGTAVGTSSGNQSIRIFGRVASPTGFFDGKFDEGSIWKRTLTDFEIQQLYALNNGGTPLQKEGGAICSVVDAILTGAMKETFLVDACLTGKIEKEFQMDAIVANILSSQLDLTWQYREHETNASFPPGMFWTDSGNSVRFFTNPSSVGVAYIIKTFKLDEITGADIKVTWERTLGNSGQGQIRVYDGTINGESLIDIPPLAGIPNTVLGSFNTISFFPKQTNTLDASSINYAGATGDIITVIFLQNDGSTSSSMALDIFEIEITGKGVWSFAGGLVITNVRGNQLVNFTDVDDFGYINANSVFGRFSDTFSIDAVLLARTCSPWKKFSEADGSSLRVTINVGDAQGSEIPPVNVPTTITGIKCSVKSASTQGSVKMRIATFPQSQLANGNFLGIPNGISTNQVIMNSLSSSVFSDFTFTFNSPCLLPGQRYMIIFDDLINNAPGMDYETILTSTKDYRQYAVTYQDPGSGTPAKFARVISRNRAPAVDIEVGGESTLICPLISAIIVDEAVWEFREVRDNNGNLTPPPNAILTTEPPRLRVRTESGSSSNTWLFKSFKKTDITGNSILLEGDNNGNTEIRVYDGQYQRDRFGDFEPANGAQPATPLKGIGLLGIVGSNPLVTSLLLPASSINYAGSTEEFITVFINNRDQVTLTAQNLDISAITMSPFLKWNFSNPTVVTESTAFGGESDWGFVRASSTEQPFMTTDFSIDACVGFFAGSRSRIGDIIILVLRANPSSTGQEVVDLVNEFTANNGLSFVGTVSRVKNWMGFLDEIGFIQEDNSDPDWYETKWISLV